MTVFRSATLRHFFRNARKVLKKFDPKIYERGNLEKLIKIRKSRENKKISKNIKMEN